MLGHGFSKAAISWILGCHPHTAAAWAGRLQAAHSLFDRPRSGRPLLIPAEVTPRLIAVACQTRPWPGCSGWSLRRLQRHLKENPELAGACPSRSTIQRRLAADSLKLHRRKYFLQIRDPDFFPKMEKIIRLFLDPPPHLFCLDECTGLQALERIAPPLPVQPGRAQLNEFEYKRRGTLSLLAILHKATGQVFARCIPDHTAATIARLLRSHARQFPASQTLHYVCDNYYSHSSETFCREVARLCGLDLPPLPTLAQRKQWLQSPAKRIIFHFLPTHGSWLNPVEVWLAILHCQALKGQSFPSTGHMQQHILQFAETWNKHLAHPFRWTYTGQDLYAKVIRRFTRWIRMQSPQLEWNFLGKQLQLMINLAEQYPGKASRQTWGDLKHALLNQSGFIRSVIDAVSLPDSKCKDPAKLARKINSIQESLHTLFSDLLERLGLCSKAA